MKKLLLIQTAFIGDVILATALIEKLHAQFPKATIDFLLRKGNESLLKGHPYLGEVIVWDKQQNKYGNLRKIISAVRKKKYDAVVNVQRFAAAGLVTALSGATQKIGFEKNPFAFTFRHKLPHGIGDGRHETERNQQLIAHLTDSNAARPKLYPSDKDRQQIQPYQQLPYYCVAPTSVWFTKQFAREKWIELLNGLPQNAAIFLLGAPDDQAACAAIMESSNHPNTTNLAGKIGLLASAALMQKAKMNYVNDSAPMHLTSAVNANVTAIFCSTIPAFGFGPLSDNSRVVETTENLTCRPCGLHGHKACPQGHFKCAFSIPISTLLEP